MEIKNLHPHKERIIVSFLLFLFLSSSQISFGQYVLDLPGTAAPNNGYIKSSASLSLSGSFTIEAWIKIEGVGIISSTGSTAHSNIVPIVTKGRSIADGPDQQEVNYFVGYDATTNRLQAEPFPFNYNTGKCQWWLYRKFLVAHNPNPVKSNKINLSFLHTVNGDVVVKVYDLAGRLQMSTTLGVSNNALNIRHKLAKGVYVLKIATLKSEMSKKIIIE